MQDKEAILRKILSKGVKKGVKRARGADVPNSLRKGMRNLSDDEVERAYQGYRSQALRQGGGPDSFLMWPFTSAAETIGVNKPTFRTLSKAEKARRTRRKANRLRKVRGAAWKYMSRPALAADTAAGNVLGKIPGAKGVFTAKEKVPWAKGLHKEVERSSALAPVTKLRDTAEPIIVGIGLEKGVEKLREAGEKGHPRQTQQGQTQAPTPQGKQQGTQKAPTPQGKQQKALPQRQGPQPMSEKAASERDDRQLREKVASKMLQLHEENKGHKKRAHAVRLLYKQAELGLIEVPHSYGEFEEKVAGLINQDLDVFEKALELTGGQVKLGELAPNTEPTQRNADEKFRAAIVDHDD